MINIYLLLYLKNLFIKVLDKMQETNDLCFSWRKIKLSKIHENVYFKWFKKKISFY